MSGTVIQFNDKIRPAKRMDPAPTGYTRTTSTFADVREYHGVRVTGSAVAAPIEIDKLYPAHETVRPELVRALELLYISIKRLEAARQKLRQKDLIGSDEEVGKFQVLLPELFRCRGIGDGYGAVLNAIEISFVNQRGRPLQEKQVTTILRILKELRERPFTDTDRAADLVEELSDTGLAVDPVTIGDLFDAEG